VQDRDWWKTYYRNRAVRDWRLGLLSTIEMVKTIVSPPVEVS